MKTIVIGLDCATWRIMNPLLEQGKLPNLQKLIENGVSGTLCSTIPPMTPLAWTSIVTGVNPGKHGIYDFVNQDQLTYRVSPVSWATMNSPAIWDLFNAHGKKLGMMNFPLAFPAPEVDSFFISGKSSSKDGKYAYPPKLRSDLDSLDYRIYPRFSYKDGAKRYFHAIQDLTDVQCDVAIKLMEDEDCDLFWTVFMGIDWIQHFLWDTEIEGQNAVNKFYQYMDEVVGRLLAHIDDDWTVVVLSDHGAQKIKGELHINSLLEDWGYLQRNQQQSKSLRDTILKTGLKLGKKLPFAVKQCLKDYIPQEAHDGMRALQNEQYRLHEIIDWRNSKAFSYGYMGRIYIHEKGKYPKGIVSPQESEAVREEIIERLRSLNHPNTGKPIVGEIFQKEQLYEGDRLENAPDIVFNPHEFSYMVYGNFGEGWFHPPQSRVADHDMDGILIMKSKAIKQSVQLNAVGIDITPTLLYLHNLPILQDMDGRVLEEALSDGFVRDHEVLIETVKHDKSLPEIESRSETEQKEIEQRLRDLGYL